MQERRVVSPGFLLAAVWGVVLLLTAYGPDVVRDEADKSDFLREQAWLHSALEGVGKAGEAVGMPALRAALGNARETVNAPYTVLAYEEPETPVEPPPPPATKTATAAAAPDALVHIAPRRPRRILVIGASSIQFAIGVELERRLPTYKGVKVKRFGQLATGLSRPDFFDWPAKLDTLAEGFKPDLVIANYGGNGAQAIPVTGKGKVAFKTPAWDEVYGERVAEMIEIARKHGAEMVFMGMPTMRSAKFTAKMRYLNRVQAEAAEAAGGMFVSTFEMAANPDGTYKKSIRYRGKRGLMRTSDGVHYRKLGAQYVVDNVLQSVERRYVLSPPEKDRATAEGHAFISRVASSTIAYTAYVPRAARGEPRPGRLVLPPAGEDWFTWPNHPHRTLQRVAEQHGVLLVVPADTESARKLQADLRANGAGSKTVRDELREDVTRHLRATELSALEGVAADQVEARLAAEFPPPAPPQ